MVPIVIIKKSPDYDSYLTLIVGTEVMALLPEKYANRIFKVGDTTFASIFMIQGSRVILSQISPQYFRRVIESKMRSLIQRGVLSVKRVAVMKNCGLAKVAIRSLNGTDPVEAFIPYIKDLKEQTGYRVIPVCYSSDKKEYIVNALYPAPLEKVRKVIYLKDSMTADVYVSPDAVGRFFGKGGWNVATASRLTYVTISIKPIT